MSEFEEGAELSARRLAAPRQLAMRDEMLKAPRLPPLCLGRDVVSRSNLAVVSKIAYCRVKPIIVLSSNHATTARWNLSRSWGVLALHVTCLNFCHCKAANR